MRLRICLDTGPLHLHFLKDRQLKVNTLFNGIKNHLFDAMVPEPVLVEVFKHLCISGGKEYACDSINSLYFDGTIQVVPSDRLLVIAAGKLKCQHRNVLSYNDANLIALALRERAIVHTTEKEWPKIPRLEIVKYTF